jgi:hypothetical protein
MKNGECIITNKKEVRKMSVKTMDAELPNMAYFCGGNCVGDNVAN